MMDKEVMLSIRGRYTAVAFCILPESKVIHLPLPFYPSRSAFQSLSFLDVLQGML
jgi:hypothetical protein